MEFGEYSENVRTLTEKVLENNGKDAKQTLKYCNEIIEFAKKTDDHKLLGFAYFYMGETYYSSNDIDHFFDAITKALTYLENIQEGALLVRCYNYLGIVACNRGNAPMSLDYYLKGLHYCQIYHVPRMECVINVNIGSMNLVYHFYAKAEECLKDALHYLEKREEEPAYHRIMLCIYNNLAKSYIFQNKLSEAETVFRAVYENHWEHGIEVETLPILCTEAMYCNAAHKTKELKELIEQIAERTTDKLPILDLFDDYYDYAEMLLDAGMDAEFWYIVDLFDPVVKKSRMMNLQMKLLSLKIRFFRLHNESDAYLHATGIYYELSELREVELHSMTKNVLAMRRNLEDANEKRKEMERQNHKLVEKSERDPLTQMANRYRFNDYSKRAFQHASRNHSSLTFEILDIDYFKEYNDNYGHQKGDECLVRVATVIRELAAEHEAFCSRYGGDEFVLIYEGIEKETALRYAKELKDKIIALAIEHKYSKAAQTVTVSQGLCWDVPTRDDLIWDYMHTADMMLYQVKENSRNDFRLENLNDGTGTGGR